MIKLTIAQKIILNEISKSVLVIGGLLCLLFGLNYIKLLLIYISDTAFYWFTAGIGAGLIVLGILFFKKADKFEERIKGLLNDRKT